MVRDQLDTHAKDQTALARKLNFESDRKLQEQSETGPNAQYKIRSYSGYDVTPSCAEFVGKNQASDRYYFGNYIDAYSCCMRLYISGYSHNENERHSGSSNAKL